MLLATALLAPPVVLRGALLVHGEIAPTVVDLRGLVSDAGVSLGLAALLALVAHFGSLGRAASMAGAALWCLLSYANFEHVLALDANATFTYAAYLADDTFLRGSVLAVSSWWLLAALLVAALALGWGALGAPPRAPRAGGLALAAGVLFAAHALWPADAEAREWRQVNGAWENALSLVRTGPGLPGAVGVRAAARPDLAGEPLVAAAGRARNVLLVVLEGVSGAHIDAISEPNGHAPAFAMRSLGASARRGVRFTTFVAQQRQTNRGEYALLCGDPPKLSSAMPKMSEIAVAGEAECLPDVLGRAGYETVYLQAAPLAFMMKDRFMAAAGFRRVLGEEFFGRAYSRTRWGVDDRAFFEQSLAVVDELGRGESPWFLMLLTAGTHHPLNIPDEAPAVPGGGAEERALAWADAAFGAFLGELEARGVLDDTLVLVTSDESAGVKRGLVGVSRLLSQSWGFLIALSPTGERAVVTAPFAQSDVALSILDYLGLAGAGSFGGRSVFRAYDEPRTLGFANTYARMAGLLDRDRLVLCREDRAGCRHYRVPQGRLFAGVPAAVPPDLPMEDRLREAVAESLVGAGAPLQSEIVLLPAQRVDLDPGRTDDQYLFGGQGLDVRESTRIEVELDLELLGEGEIDLAHDLVSSEGTLFSRAFTGLAAGQGVRLRYSYLARTPHQRVTTRLWTSAIRGRDLVLEVRTARLRLHPAAASASAPPLDVHELDLFRSASAR